MENNLQKIKIIFRKTIDKSNFRAIIKAQQGSNQRKSSESEQRKALRKKTATDFDRMFAFKCILCGTIERSVQTENETTKEARNQDQTDHRTKNRKKKTKPCSTRRQIVSRTETAGKTKTNGDSIRCMGLASPEPRKQGQIKALITNPNP